jgi:thioredoxin 1
MADIIGTNQNFKAEVNESKGKVLVDFWATWCGPCQMLSPIIEEIANENSNLKVVKVDVDQEQEIAIQYNVTAIPTIAIFEDGKLKETIIGFHQKADYLKALGL